jgi:hypothetical protein
MAIGIGSKSALGSAASAHRLLPARLQARRARAQRERSRDIIVAESDARSVRWGWGRGGATVLLAGSGWKNIQACVCRSMERCAVRAQSSSSRPISSLRGPLRNRSSGPSSSRCFFRRLRVAEAVQSALHEPDPPLADRLPRQPGPLRGLSQRRHPALVRAGQHNPRPLGQRLRRRPLARQGLQRRALHIGQNQRDKLRTRHSPSLQTAKSSRTQNTRANSSPLPPRPAADFSCSRAADGATRVGGLLALLRDEKRIVRAVLQRRRGW